MTSLRAPWADPDDEYDVLSTFVVPAALADYQRTLQDWNAVESKALNLLALDAAVVAGLVAVRTAVHNLWWLPAFGCGVAAAFFIASIWPRRVDFGPDLIDYHDELRGDDVLTAARTMVEKIVSAAAHNDTVVDSKSSAFVVGLGFLAMSLLGALPVVLLRP